MGVSKFSIIVVFLFCTNTLEVPVDNDVEGYYWRDYKNATIPKDALPGGTNSNNNPTYIGQILHGSLLIPAKIDPEVNKVTYEWGYKEYVTYQNIKILCTKHPEQFEWLHTGNGLLQNIDSELLVVGGYEPNLKVYIGRKQIGNELVLGKVVSSQIQSTLNTSKDGNGTQHAEFDVLTYHPNKKTLNKPNQAEPLLDVRMSPDNNSERT